MTRTLLALACLVMLCAPTSHAAQDEVREERLRKLGEELRCLVCQNQTIADSQSGLADDLRREIRAQMDLGKNDAEITAYLVDRYGDFVRYRPPVKATTYLLWFGPALAGIAGLGWLVSRVRQRTAVPSQPTLNDDERARLATLLTTDAEGEGRA